MHRPGETPWGTKHQGVMHADIKPKNIVVYKDKENGEYYGSLIDLETSKVLKEDSRGVKKIGTLGYTAPEIARGEKNGKPADIWSMGITLLEMFKVKNNTSKVCMEEDPNLKVITKENWSPINELFKSWKEDVNLSQIPKKLKNVKTKLLNKFLKHQIECFAWECLKENPDDRISSEELVERLEGLKTFLNLFPSWRKKK